MAKPDALQRENEGWLQPLERPALLWLAARMPLCMTPDRLTAIGFAGAVLCLIGYAGMASSLMWAWLATLGLVVNWFGDSLDGNLARYRKIERPRYGYFVDNALDVAEQFICTVGVGLSGYVRWDICLLSFSAFMMMSALTFLRANVGGVYQLTYGGLGPTEIRVMGIGLNTIVFFFPPQRPDWLGLPLSYPNVLSLIWGLAVLATFCVVLVKDIRRLSAEDPPRQP